jgi:hypothetical protein
MLLVLPFLQVAGLPRLQRLTLTHGRCLARGYSALVQLSKPHSAAPDLRTAVPACLAQLTQLKSFMFRNYGDDADLGRALPSLQQLTALYLEWLTPPLSAALPALPRLHLLAVVSSRYSAMALPGGGWLESLRLLILSWDELMASLPLLEAAPHLEVVATDRFLRYTHTLAQLVAWAGKRQLRRLLLPNKSARLYPADKRQIADLFGRHPGVTVELHEYPKRYKERMMLLVPDLADWLKYD